MSTRRPLRVMVVIGTRPDAIKMAPVVIALRKRPEAFKTVLVSTGQHREMLLQVLADFELSPDFDLDLMTANQSLPSLSSAVMTTLSSLIVHVRPDVVLVQGDTTTAMVAALSSFYARVSVGHVEAGLRTGNRYSPFPEEVNRKLISAIATWHYAPTETALQALIREAIPAESVLLTGNTVVDALLHMSDRTGDPPKRDKQRMILVTAHRRESFGDPLEQLCIALLELVQRNPDVRVVYPVHLNPNVELPVRKMLQGEPRIQLMSPVPYPNFTLLLKSCFLVLTDSGGIQEEAPVFGKPVLVLRNVTERPEAVAAGTVKVIGTESASIVREAEILLRDQAEYLRMAKAVSPYGDGHAATRIADHLAGVRDSILADQLAGGAAAHGRPEHGSWPPKAAP